MNLTPDERQAIEQMKAEAHDLATRPDGSVTTRHAAGHFVRLLRDAEGISPAVIGAFLDDLAVKGAAKVMSDWRRAQRTTTATAKGTKVDAPKYAGTKRPDTDGDLVHVQLALAGMTLDELRDHKDRLEATRNTLSREVRLIADVIAVMEAEGYATAGQAIDHLRDAA